MLFWIYSSISSKETFISIMRTSIKSSLTIAPRYIPAYEVQIFFILETILGPIWVWLVIHEQPSSKTIIGGIVIMDQRTQELKQLVQK